MYIYGPVHLVCCKKRSGVGYAPVCAEGYAHVCAAHSSTWGSKIWFLAYVRKVFAHFGVP